LILSTIILLSGLLFVGIDSVQAYEEVSGIISADTTWTKANSPYNFTGNVAIDKEATLTIEPGVTINLGRYYIRVNGTLIAKGTNADKIFFNDGSTEGIEFTSSSTRWNGQTNSGSIIENSIISSRLLIDGGSPLIHKNAIGRSITITGGSPVISKNTITGQTGGAAWSSGTYGIYIYNDSASFIVDNTIAGTFSGASLQIEGGSPTIQRNQISNNYGYGSHPDNITAYDYNVAAVLIYQAKSAQPLIEQNTITKSAIGLSFFGGSDAIIRQNNIVENTYDLHLSIGTKNNIDAANNWWGTTDTTVIDQKIYDYNDDFNIGKVNYTPVLTTANLNAMPDLNAPLPTPQVSAPSISPTDSQNTPEMPDQSGSPTVTSLDLDWGEIAIITLLSVIAVLLVIMIVVMRKKSAK